MDRIKVRPMVKTFRRGLRKPSQVKITVSAPSQIFTSSPVKTEASPETIVKSIMAFAGNMGSEEEDDTFVHRISVDNSVVDFPNCVDFGIQDFLCYNEEIDLELSSDTDSFLEATPPHRFSDSELESQIEIMSITLDNALNLYPRRRASFSNSLSKDDTFTFDLIRIENQTQEDVADIEQIEEAPPRRLPPPRRPFRRQISLPASIFMTYLMAEKHSQKIKEKRISLTNESPRPDFVRSERFVTRKLAKIDGSYSSNDSTEETTSPNDSKNNLLSSGNGEGMRDHNIGDSCFTSFSSESPRDTPNKLFRLIGNSVEDFDQEDENAAFTSELERKSLMLRYMRKLVRQDTSYINLAPCDYSI